MAETQREILARIDECVGFVLEDVKEIKTDLKELNHCIDDTNIKLAKTEEIAQDAKGRAIDNRRYTDKWVVAIVAALITADAGIVAVAVVNLV